MSDDAIRILIVEDHALVRDALIDALAPHPRIEVAAAVGRLDEAVDCVQTLRLDVVLADLQLPDGLGSDLVESAAARNIPVVLMTGTDDKRGVEQALERGCAGFVSKAQGLGRLTEAVLAVAAGAAFFPAALLAEVMKPTAVQDTLALTERELEILRLLADAQTVAEIAERLHLSPHTVRNHIKPILAKLGARSQLEAVVRAARLGIVDLSA